MSSIYEDTNLIINQNEVTKLKDIQMSSKTILLNKESFESQDTKYINDYINNHINTHTFNTANYISYTNAHIFTTPTYYHPIVKSLNTLKSNYEKRNTRKVPKRNKIIICCTIGLSIALTVLWFYRLITFTLNNLLYNFLWIPLTCLSIFILLFPIHIVTSGCANMFGSTEFFFKNSKYYSCIREIIDLKNKYDVMQYVTNTTEEEKEITNNLSDELAKITYGYVNVTIQIPVYKEDFDTVIKPTIKSAMLCRKYYEKVSEHNITVNIFINDDGLQVIDKEDREKRIEFYDRYNIGYVARPKEGRAGKFKKASNMNFGLKISRNYMKLIENMTCESALETIKEEYSNINKNKCVLIGNDICVGDYILLLDSDTRIPINCLHDVIKEFKLYSHLGYTQHLTYPMIVTNTYWERFIAHFTTLIYDLAIPISVAGGDVSPLVGHCAILRSSALWELHNEGQVWSENNVSEDFKLFMDLTAKGYYGRYITYTSNIDTEHFQKHNFMEGISLEFIDELAKFKKYGYGTCEMLFNPFKDWFKKGPIGSPILEYCKSDIEITSKLGIISYLFTYVAIAIGLPLSYINYFIFGWFHNYIDTQVLPVYVALQVSLLFSGLGTLANSIFKARVLRKDAVNVIWYNLLQIPFYFFFFGSLPYHLAHIMLKYFFSIENISWGSTQKEVSYSSRYDAFMSTIKEFKYMYMLFSLTICMIILMVTPAIPQKWRITQYNAITPLLSTCVIHMFGPIVLNPYIMTNNKLKKLVEDDNEHNINMYIQEVDT